MSTSPNQPISQSISSAALTPDVENAAAQAVWSVLTSDPETGVVIVSIEGQILYANVQAARIYFGPEAQPDTYVGKFFHEVNAREWAEERMALLREVARTGKPVLLRTIWRGFQVHSWIHPLPPESEDAMNEDDGLPATMPERFLVIARRVAADEDAEALTSEPVDIIESDVADLGPLETLTPREMEVLALIGQGLSMKEIAHVLKRSVKTVDNHRMSIGKKLDVHDRVKLSEIARRAGLTLRDATRHRV